MSDTVPAPAPAPDPAPSPAPAPEADNATIRQMREQLESLRKANSQYEAERAAAERAKLDEVERLKAELEAESAKARDADALKTSLTSFEARFEAMYTEALAGAPDDKREALSALSASGNWAERYDALRNGLKLIGAASTVQAGTATSPVVVVPPESPAAKGFDPKNPPAWQFKQ